MLSYDNDAAPAPGLPRLCYARQPSTGATVLIVRGEAGYHPVQTFLTPEQLNATLAKPPTREQVQAMLLGSMFDWHAPGAVPARHAVATPEAGMTMAVPEPLPLFPVVANWGGPDAPFRLMWRSRIFPPASASPDPLWTCAGQHLGYYGWLRVADQRARQAFGCGLLNMPPCDWEAVHISRVSPTEAADGAIDEYAARHGTGSAGGLSTANTDRQDIAGLSGAEPQP